jgi:hypothetical protein
MDNGQWIMVNAQKKFTIGHLQIPIFHFQWSMDHRQWIMVDGQTKSSVGPAVSHNFFPFPLGYSAPGW